MPFTVNFNVVIGAVICELVTADRLKLIVCRSIMERERDLYTIIVNIQDRRAVAVYDSGNTAVFGAIGEIHAQRCDRMRIICALRDASA